MSCKNIVAIGLIGIACFVVAHAITDDEAIEGMTFLQSFGYYSKNDKMGPSEIKGSEDVKRSIRNFQQFYNLPITGELDQKTMEAMRTPRCGVPDPTMPNEDGDVLGGKLKKRYTHTGPRWETTTLTYRILSYPRNGNTRGVITNAQVDDIVARAFAIWSDQTPLTFNRATEGYAEIYLSFGTYDHGDLYPFDGPNGVLAHAYAPNTFGDLGGDVHFDDSEYFTRESFNGYNLFQVAAHEIGHSLGMGHSNVDGALMFPSYPGYQPSFRLPDDDIRGIQALYGSRVDTGGPKPTYSSGDVEGCNKIFTAVNYLRGEIFAFQKDKYWRISSNGELITDIDGEENKYFWNGLPDNVDAGYERWEDSRIIFFKDDDYYMFDGNVLMDGPLKIADLTRPGETPIPNNIDAVLTFGEYSTTYFFKGSQVWRYNEYRKSVDPGYPAYIGDVFRGVPNDVTAAFRYNDGNTYFLKGKEYYRYNDRNYAVDSGYPRLFGVDFLGCNVADIVGETGTAAVSVSSALFIIVSSVVSLVLAI